MDFRIRTPEMTHQIYPTTMTYSMCLLMIAPLMYNLVFTLMAPQVDHSMNVPSMSASFPMDNNVNDSFEISRSPLFSQLLNLNDDEIMTLLDETSFDIIVQDSNHPTTTTYKDLKSMSNYK